MLVKAIIILFMLIIIYSLGSALFFLVRDNKTDETRVVKALTWRIGLSMLLFVLLLMAFAFGLISPHSI